VTLGYVQKSGPIDLQVRDHLDAEVEDPGDLALDHVGRQTEGGDARTQQTTDDGSALVDGDPVPHASQMVGRRQTGRPGADDSDLLRPALGTGQLDRPVVGGEALHLPNVDGAVELDPVARRHAGCGTDPAAHRREGGGPEENL